MRGAWIQHSQFGNASQTGAFPAPGIHATHRSGASHAGYLEAIWVTPLALVGEASIAVSIAGVTSDRDDT